MPKVLVLRFSSIGDIVLTSPVVRCLKEQLPGAEIHFATKKRFHSLVENNPHIHSCHYLTNNFNLFIRELRREKFDYIIDLHYNLRTWKIKRLLGTKSFSFRKLNIQKWLLVHFRVNNLPHVHVVDRYFETVSSLGIRNDGIGLEYFIPEKDRLSVFELPESHRNGFIAFAIGGQHTTKRMPLRRLISLCKQIDQPLVLLGGKEDAETGSILFNTLGSRIYNACGIYSINKSASLISLADKVISHDTGLMHIAAALHKPIVSLWGNTVPDFGMTPYMPGEEYKSTIVEVKDLPCRPCSKIGHSSCPKKHFHCMNKIDEQQVIAAVAKDYNNIPG